MGGRAAGDVASALFARVITDSFSTQSFPIADDTSQFITNSFNEAHTQIIEQALANPHQNGMGCTAELLVIHDRKFTLGHVGDSRTYRLRNGILHLLTKDHSFVQEQLDSGLIKPEQARSHSMRNIILRAIGMKNELKVDIIEGSVTKGDIFMLCTDGLYTMLDESRMRDILLAEIVADIKTSMLINLANAAGGKDNITIVLVEIH